LILHTLLELEFENIPHQNRTTVRALKWPQNTHRLNWLATATAAATFHDHLIISRALGAGNI
jgi:hypothetical protein